MIKILVTGAAGFLGKNLIADLKNDKKYEILEYHHSMNDNILDEFCDQAHFVFHLAGVNRPANEEEFFLGNIKFTKKLLFLLKKHNNNCPVVLSSSIQAEINNAYGRSKLLAEELLNNHSRNTGTKVYIYRLPNVFGKWCKPNYNSVIATFCYNIARNIPITINNIHTELKWLYIDDLISVWKEILNGKIPVITDGICELPRCHDENLGNIVNLIRSFGDIRNTLLLTNLSEGSFAKKLYSTYLSYLPENNLSYDLIMHEDYRGSFTEILHTKDVGQVSVNISKPGITKGNHWHHTKVEKFVVVSGSAVLD